MFVLRLRCIRLMSVIFAFMVYGTLGIVFKRFAIVCVKNDDLVVLYRNYFELAA